MDFLLRSTLVFFAAVVTDAVWAYYIKHTGSGHLLRASGASSIIVLLGGFITVEYMDDKRLLVAGALGAFCGTYLLMRYEKDEPVDGGEGGI